MGPEMIAMSPSEQKDELLESNAGFLWLAVLAFVPSAIILFGLAAQIGPLIPFAAAALVNLTLLGLDAWRPTYPFRIFHSETPPEWLTDEQRRVLTYLRSPEARRSKRYLCVAMLLVAALSTWAPPFLGRAARWVSSYLVVRTSHALNDSATHILAFLIFQALASYSALFGWGCWRALRQWDEIQARYEPWPLSMVAKGFHIVKKPTFTGEGESLPRPSRPMWPPGAIRGDTPVSGRQVLAVICFIPGCAALFVGGTSLPRDLFRTGVSIGSRVGLDLALVVAGLILLWVAGRLWRRG
jgi:hypothetical protein